VAGPMDFGLELLASDEGVEGVILLSYGMEQGLGEFYKTVASAVTESEPKKLLKHLAGIEERHMKRLFDLYRSLAPEAISREEMASKVSADMVEGGHPLEKFIEEHKPLLQNVSDILSLAMMIEAQALDLYLRYSERVEQSSARKIFYGLAEEEKAHLASLGEMMEKAI